MKCFHIMLPEKYPGYYEEIEFPGVSQYLMDEIKNELKKYDINPTRNTHVTLKIVFQYADDTQEVLKMPQLSEKHISAMHVREFRQYLPKIDNYTMKKHFGVPPDTPEKSVYLEEYLLLYAPIYICGRYNRYTKKIFQDHHPNSIEQIVIKAISTVMRTPKENIKVSFCGKDGAFDRILENGKPFFVAITNHNIPLRGLTHTQLDQIEHLCNLVEDCRIFRLSNTVFKSVQLLSEFEKMGCRKYDLIVWTDAPNVAQCIACLNREGEKVPMLITQKTPISALKYRPLLTRTRYVRLLKAEPIEGENCKFKMLLKVDAGTYVDELFHGDLGRTTPSISTIIGGFNVVITHRDLLDLEGEIPSYDDEPLENEAQSSYTED
ncbi:tRNA pseudouridine synthase Pus10 isoform X2 [Aethina tumida]|nr:tRNA pseudouridine synthase Pus10 isoform X2 [Aethina tumida]